MYTVFSTIRNDALREPMFLGNPVNLARYDQQKLVFFEKLIEKQLSFFWRPEEIDLSKDRVDFLGLDEHEKHIFLSNLKYQTLLDSIQGRSPNVALLPLVSLPELETWIETWSFYETIHSRSYTHIIRNLVHEPSEVFDSILLNRAILERARDISYYYDRLMKLSASYHYASHTPSELHALKRSLLEALYLCLISINALEGIRFYVSFACAFAFAEQRLMEGNAKLIKFIARDEALHLTGTEHMLNLIHRGEDDPLLAEIASELREQAINLFLTVAKQEKTWAKYLFQSGSIVGLNEEILTQYVEYITHQRMLGIGLSSPFSPSDNPIPWITSWLSSDRVQVAPQEVEMSSYLVGQVDASISVRDLEDIEL